MAASLTGTQQFHGSSANSGSTSITVPADCTAVLVYFTGWISGSTHTMSSVTLGGNAPYAILQNLANSGDETAAGVALWVNPPTGSQTFAWDWSGTTAMEEGASFTFAYAKDVNTSDPVSDSDVDAWSGTVTGTLTLTTASTDFVLGTTNSYQPNSNPNGAPTGSDQTIVLNDQASNSQSTDLSYETTTDTPSTVYSGSGYYGSVIAVALKEAPAGGATWAGRLVGGNLVGGNLMGRLAG